jgi:hypothetical protein
LAKLGFLAGSGLALMMPTDEDGLFNATPLTREREAQSREGFNHC